jgi:CheY-like chemotaxis protein
MPRLLIIDDDPDVLASLRAVLSTEGFDVTVARSATEAVEKLNFANPDCIITDIYMPVSGGDGFELMDAIRRYGIKAPVIVITGGSAEAHRIAQSLGAAATVPKPFRPEDLIEVINRVIESRGGVQSQEMEHGGPDGG